MKNNDKSHARYFLERCIDVCREIDSDQIDRLAGQLKQLRERRGRLFVLGVGGSAGNAGHAVNDFRKLCRIEAYAPTDNVSELTARTNDEGFETVFEEYLKGSHASKNDAIMVFSVGGGNAEKNVSVNLINAIDFARNEELRIFGIVGRDGGYAKINGDEVVLIPDIEANLVTPLSESFQAVIWHALVSHPELQVVETKW